MQAAERVMADHGVHGTKIADIANEADVGVGTFYLHFSTKEELFDALVADAAARLEALLDAQRAKAEDVVEEITRSITSLCAFASENREIFRVVFGHGATYHEVVRDMQALFTARLAETIRTGIDQGRLAAADPEIAAEALVGMCTQLLAWWTRRDGIPVTPLEQTLTTLTLRGLAPAPA